MTLTVVIVKLWGTSDYYYHQLHYSSTTAPHCILHSQPVPGSGPFYREFAIFVFNIDWTQFNWLLFERDMVRVGWWGFLQQIIQQIKCIEIISWTWARDWAFGSGASHLAWWVPGAIRVVRLDVIINTDRHYQHEYKMTHQWVLINLLVITCRPRASSQILRPAETMRYQV